MFILRPLTAPAARRAVLSLVLAVAIAPLPGIGRGTATAETVDTPVCRVHLQKIDMTLARAQAELQAAMAQGLEAECAAMHGQVRAMLEVRNIYRRCTTGPEQVETVALMDGSIGQTADRISARCAKRSAEVTTD